jgi:hypothetical protein
MTKLGLVGRNQIAVRAPLCASAINPTKQLRTIGDTAAVMRRSANDLRMIGCVFHAGIFRSYIFGQLAPTMGECVGNMPQGYDLRPRRDSESTAISLIPILSRNRKAINFGCIFMRAWCT